MKEIQVMEKWLLLISLSVISVDALSAVALQSKDNLLAAATIDDAVGILSTYDKSHQFSPLPRKIFINKNEKVYLKLNQVGAWFWASKSNHFKVGGMITTDQWWEYDGTRLRDINIDGNLPMTGINAAYQNGRFRAETGVLNNESSGAKFFLKGAYIVAKTPHFSLELTAKIEALDHNLVEHYYGESYNGISDTNFNTLYQINNFKGESSENTSLSLTGSYSFGNNWSITGSVITTTLGQELTEIPVIQGISRNMALIGTTYSF